MIPIAEGILNPNILSAVPFDMNWANGEVKHCRIRFRRRGIYALQIDDEEIISLLSEIWVSVVAGKVGRFRADPSRPLHSQLQAYVVGCLDNEVMRYLRSEGSRSLFSLAQGEAHPECVSLLEGHAANDEADEPERGGEFMAFMSAQDNSNPLCALLEAENNAGFSCNGHPGQIGGLLASWIERGYAIDLRHAQAIRARRRPAGKETPSKTRINFAWAVVMTSFDHDPESIRRLSPLLCARWIDEDRRSTRKLIEALYPDLGSSPKTEAIAAREGRNALRFLSIRAQCGSAVGPEHLRYVAEDAVDAMVNWVGVREAYRKKKEESSGEVSPDTKLEALSA